LLGPLLGPDRRPRRARRRRVVELVLAREGSRRTGGLSRRTTTQGLDENVFEFVPLYPHLSVTPTNASSCCPEALEVNDGVAVVEPVRGGAGPGSPFAGFRVQK